MTDTDVQALIDRLCELETTCILESEQATDDGQMRAWHERAECAFRSRDALAQLQATVQQRDAQVREAFDAGWFAALDNTRSVAPKIGFQTRKEAFAAYLAREDAGTGRERGHEPKEAK